MPDSRDPTPRRNFLKFSVAAAGGTALFCTRDWAIAQAKDPTSAAYRQAIREVRVGVPTGVANNSGDTWVATLADDGNLYTPSNDTGGFHGEELIFSLLPELTAKQKERYKTDPQSFWKELSAEQTARLESSGPGGSIAFNRLTGSDPMTLDGLTVNWMRDFVKQDSTVVRDIVDHFGKKMEVAADGRTWKSSGCASIDGALYWLIARHQYGEISGDPHLRQTALNASFIKSTDYGKTWVRSAKENLEAPMFPGSYFAAPYIIDYGSSRIAVDNADQCVYAISNNGFWDNGDRLILGRVQRKKIGLLNGADWEFFNGSDGLQPHAWTPHASQARPLLERTGRLGMTGVTYLPERGRYMMIGWYYPAGGGKVKDAHTKTVWDFYEARRPWGPWTQIGSHTWSPQGYYCPCICPKFQSASRIYVFTAGDWTNRDVYHLTVVPVDVR